MEALKLVAADRAARAVTDTFSMVVDLNGPLSIDRLATAWRRIGHRYPILRARLGDPGDRIWTLQADLAPVAVVDEAEGIDGAGMYPGAVEQDNVDYERQLTERDLWKLLVVRRRAGDRMVITGHHAHMDASSLIDVLGTLATYYNAASHCSLPQAHDQTRCIGDLLASTSIGASTQAQVFSRFLRRWNGLPVSTHADANHVSASGWAACEITQAMPFVEDACEVNGWKTSAALLALVARAWGRVFPSASSGSDGWQVAFDLRSELNRRGSIGNFSTTEPITLVDVCRPELRTLVTEAHRTFAGLSSTWPGLGAALGALQMDSLPTDALDLVMQRSVAEVRRCRYGRSFSNIGRFPKETEHWGDARSVGAIFVPRQATADMTTMACSSIAGRTHLAMRTQSPGLRRTDIEALGDEIVAGARLLR